MYEERERFSWTSLFIKIIIIVIFVLFTIWLLQLSVKSANKDISNGINVLTDNIFSQNVERMKDVGTSYFTTERLPKKVGEVKTLTLEEMYKNNLILEVKDKNGKACSAKNSYVAIEKLETEYQMKVYLDCNGEQNFIKVIMGCYNYCNTDICEKKEQPSQKAIEYEYSKTTGGAWGPWGSWSDWSTNAVSKTDYRDVETKTEYIPYTYEEEVTETKDMGYANVCDKITGYELVSNKNGVCTYSKSVTTEANPVCPDKTSEGYSNPTRNGFTCTYTKGGYVYANPVCPDKTSEGYSDPTRNGFTCSYSKTVTSSTDYELVYYGTGSGSYVPSDTNRYHYVQTSADYQYKCNSTCAFQWYYIYKIYTKNYKTETVTITADAVCPKGYNPSGNRCAKATSSTITDNATCPKGYNPSGNKCVKTTTTSKTENAKCPSDQTLNNKKCYKEVTTTHTVDSTKKITYYRYRLREYSGGYTDYKWSSSNNDKNLLDAGYRLTGKTREILGGKK